MQQKTISIMGCGWLGLPLAKELVRAGYQVKGSTTSPEKIPLLAAEQIAPFLLSFPENSPKTALADFLQSDVLFLNIPPSRGISGSTSYETLLRTVLEAAPASLQAILFISSTSVYPDVNREVVEQDAVASAASPSLMLRCEHLVQQETKTKATIVRFGGLMGGNRHPGRWLAGKTEVPQPHAPVNMIHLADCMGLILQIIKQEKWGFTFNACAPMHPTRKEFYSAAAQHLNLVPPLFASPEKLRYKSINSDLVQRKLQYNFECPDPLACLASPAF